MAQATILAAAQTAAQSTDIVVPAGTQVTVSLFAASKINQRVRCPIHQKGPTGSRVIGYLNGRTVSTVLSGPGTFFVTRPAITEFGLNVGVFTES